VEKNEKNLNKKFQFRKEKFRLRNRYRNWTLVSVPNTETKFLSHTISDEQDMRPATSATSATSAYTAAAGKTSRILDTRPKALISSYK
jgi:hypothetical protein